MIEGRDTKVTGGDRRRGKCAWNKPELTRLDAGQAEVGTRPSVSDGGFTTS